MNARELEAQQLARCMAVATGLAMVANDQRDANVFRLAAMVLRSRFTQEYSRLLRASDRYFLEHPNEKLAPNEVVNRGWVLSLPRLRDMLSQKLDQTRGKPCA